MYISKRNVNILIACEESQRECIAFRKRGFRAFSCDIKKCSGEHPEWHILHDVTPYLQGKTIFYTQDGRRHRINKWHLIIAHPPCTYLSKVSSRWMYKDGIIDKQRYKKMLEARDFFYICLNANAQFVVVENPRPMARANLPPVSAQVSPHWFGSRYSKHTYYWLRNLPPLMPTFMYSGKPVCLCRVTWRQDRSKTDNYLAEAVATQWGDYIIKELNKKQIY